MAIACPVDLNTATLRSEISSIYGRVATEPSGEFHFHRGPAYAAEFLGYDASELATLPPESTASFAGVGNPLAIGPIHPGETVLDIGCGAGMDLFLAAKRTGAVGHAIGVDDRRHGRASAQLSLNRRSGTGRSPQGGRDGPSRRRRHDRCRQFERCPLTLSLRRSVHLPKS